jgi:outer membrane murein-binding lipoprotein Lpp
LQDILTALQRHPEWRTALRQQLLGEELLEMPVLFAKFATETTRRLDLLTQDLAATNKRLDRLDADVGTLKNDVGTLKNDMGTLKNDVGTLKNDVGTLKNDVGTLKNDMGTLKNDVGTLKGAHAETKARANIAVIADELDLEYRRIVPGVELRRVARDNGADLRDDEIKSFVASDIMAEAIDAEGNTTYLAVEASYTGDLHDADRARSHAALMQRFTNKPCRAVIASARNNDRLVELVDSGEVAWHHLQVRIQPAN